MTKRTLLSRMAMRYRVVLPLLALLVTSGYVVGLELLPPGPTFRDVAELEGLAEPTGITVVENGLYIVSYMVNASVWSTGFLFIGLVEYVARWSWDWAPADLRPRANVRLPTGRQQAIALASIGGVLHAAIMTWFAARLGLAVSSGSQFVLYLYGAFGMWLLAAVPLYLLAISSRADRPLRRPDRIHRPGRSGRVHSECGWPACTLLRSLVRLPRGGTRHRVCRIWPPTADQRSTFGV